MDVDGHSTSTPKAGSSSCTEEVEETKNKKQRKEKDPRMSTITSAGVRDLFGGDEGKSFHRQSSGMSAGELEKMKREKEKQFENDPRMSSMTSWYRCRERAAVGLGIHFASERCFLVLAKHIVVDSVVSTQHT